MLTFAFLPATWLLLNHKALHSVVLMCCALIDFLFIDLNEFIFLAKRVIIEISNLAVEVSFELTRPEFVIGCRLRLGAWVREGNGLGGLLVGLHERGKFGLRDRVIVLLLLFNYDFASFPFLLRLGSDDLLVFRVRGDERARRLLLNHFLEHFSVCNFLLVFRGLQTRRCARHSVGPLRLRKVQVPLAVLRLGLLAEDVSLLGRESRLFFLLGLRQ